jgi:hypothetical protein
VRICQDRGSHDDGADNRGRHREWSVHRVYELLMAGGEDSIDNQRFLMNCNPGIGGRGKKWGTQICLTYWEVYCVGRLP